MNYQSDIIFEKFFKFLIFNLISLIIINHLYGIYNQYTPIPFWDAWVSYILFPDIQNKSYADYFFSRHNGSHILLTHRITEIIDWKFFSGSQIFTTVSLAICPIILAWLYCGLLIKQQKNIYSYAVIFGLMLSWVQWENFKWPFQDQMYFVLIFSYLAISCKKNYCQKWSQYYLIGYIITALLAIFSMGNGLLIPIICSFYSILSIFLSKVNRKSNVCIVFASSICIGVWFLISHGGGTGIPAREYLDLLEVIYSTLALIGSPIHIVFGLGKLWAAATGGLILAGCVYLAIIDIRLEINNIYIQFLSFLVTSSLITVYARYLEFPNAWETSRYQGLVMSIWVIAFIKAINNGSLDWVKRGIIFVVITTFILASLQKFYKIQHEDMSWVNFEKSMGVLSLINKVHDEKELNTFFPWYTVIMDLTEVARLKCAGVFGSSLFRNACLGVKLNSAEAQSQQLKIYVVKYEPVENFNRVFMLVDCPSDLKSLRSASIILKDNQFNALIGRDAKNFGEKCRVGAYIPIDQSSGLSKLLLDERSYTLRDK